MAVTNAMFLFEVVVENVKSFIESRVLVIKSDFADVFSLELKDPKQMHIVMPEPLPLPPAPPGKGKKKKKPPKPKKGKKGKKGVVEVVPAEPAIQSGQSVLFSSSAEILIQNMKKFPLELSLWNKEENLVFIGTTSIPWDEVFLKYLEKIYSCEIPPPAVMVKDDYNIFEEGTAKLMATLGIQVKLTYLRDKVTTAFRTLSEDPTIKKYLYTGINSKTTSYMCTLKTSDEIYIGNSNKIENNFIVDKPKPKNIAYADYKNAPGANLTFFGEDGYCCMGHADKPPESIYKAPETCPDIDFIVDYVRKIIVSCNDNMRMLTPQTIIKPRIKATDIDRLCYCKETNWPRGEFSERFQKEAQSGPCPICIDAGKRSNSIRPSTFDVANIRGPCGRPDCRIARDMREYIENLAEEDMKEINIQDVIGPCGSKQCTLAGKIQQFLRHEGIFSKGSTVEGLSTQCACLQQMQLALTKTSSCDTVCTKDCDDSSGEGSQCGGTACPSGEQKVYNVYYFTVEHDFETKSPGTTTPGSEYSKYQYCSSSCPSAMSSEKTGCSKSECSTALTVKKDDEDWNDDSKCQEPVCPSKVEFPPSPADSNVVMKFNDIYNACHLDTCDVADTVKDFITDSVINQKNKSNTNDADHCYCDCVCSFKFSKKTTYCAVCGGYECMGDDMRNAPEYMKPQPCPVYHKLYDKHYIKVPNPWPEAADNKKQTDNASMKSTKTAASKAGASERGLTTSRSNKSVNEQKSDMKKAGERKDTKEKQKKKKVGKFTVNVEANRDTGLMPVEKKPEVKYPYPAVPKGMGWNWKAEDIPGMKPRPKWKPGAANKILVRRYRAMREGIDTIAKKKRAMMQRKKKIEMKPTLIVKKRDGEYTVQMEVFKKYSKERLAFQYPYDEKPPLIYTIGKTAEEKLKIQKQRDRRERRETRRKSRLLQSTFRDRCQEICLKAYNQAIGILPLPNPNDPDCPCYTKPAHVTPPIDSCSCSDVGTISSTDTDDDEWTIEFTPPVARWDPKAKHPSTLAENESQYNYLDYKVKILDKTGNPIPRFFKGLDGKQVCSDLGGFWGPDHVWLEINKDGYIGPDERWVPMNFIGPDGMFYSAEDGTFTDTNNQILKIGIDGYIDKDGKWAYYCKRKTSPNALSTATGWTTETKKATKSKEHGDAKGKAAAVTTSPIKSKGGDKGGHKSGHKSATSTPTKDRTVKVHKGGNTTKKGKDPIVMSASMNWDRYNHRQTAHSDQIKYEDSRRLAKCCEIMQGLQMCDEIYELKCPIKTNRASNTPRKTMSPHSTVYGNWMKFPITATTSFANRPTASIN